MDDIVQHPEDALNDLNEAREVIRSLRIANERLAFERTAAEIDGRSALMQTCRTAAGDFLDRGELAAATAWLGKVLAIAEQSRRNPRLDAPELDDTADRNRLRLLLFADRRRGTALTFPAGGAKRRVAIATVIASRDEAELAGRVLWPALMAKGNLPALARRARVVVTVFTTAFIKPFVSRQPALEALKSHADIQFQLFPDSLAEGAFDREQLDGQLGVLALHQARAAGADVVLLRPDMLVGDRLLSACVQAAEAGSGAVLSILPELDRAAMLEWLDRQRTGDGGFPAPNGRTLARAALERLGTGMLAHIAAPESSHYFPTRRVLAWPTPDGLVVRAAERHALFVAHALLARAERLPWAHGATALVAALAGADRSALLVDGSPETFGVYALRPSAPLPHAPSRFDALSFGEWFWRSGTSFGRWLLDRPVVVPGAVPPSLKPMSAAALAEEERGLGHALAAYQPTSESDDGAGDRTGERHRTAEICGVE